MPPKAKFTREEITSAAMEIVKSKGISALTARALAEKLQSSARPIFTVFESMDEVVRAVTRAAKDEYNNYIKKAFSEAREYDIKFKSVGAQYIGFAVNEPELFHLLFMSERKGRPDLQEILHLIDENYEEILLSIKDNYGFDDSRAEKLYRHMWIYSHGIATLCATGMCGFTGREISEMMTEACAGILRKLREEEND